VPKTLLGPKAILKRSAIGGRDGRQLPRPVVVPQRRGRFRSATLRRNVDHSPDTIWPKGRPACETGQLAAAGGFNAVCRQPEREALDACPVKGRLSPEGRCEDLAEVSTALRVLMKKREADRRELEEKVLSNVRLLIRPYLEKMKRSRLDFKQRAYVAIMESNLDEIVASLSYRLSFHYLGFTPAEIRVASLIKQGKRAGEIAGLLGISIRTVEGYRFAIRRRLGINGKNRNLRTCLLAIG
jgi:DNA-binding CsgD family transcriptional regulator